MTVYIKAHIHLFTYAHVRECTYMHTIITPLHIQYQRVHVCAHTHKQTCNRQPYNTHMHTHMHTANVYIHTT